MSVKRLLFEGLRRSILGRLLRKVQPAVRTPYGFTMVLDLDDHVSSRAVLGMYERHEAQVFRRVMTPGAVVVDAGANIGFYTLLAAASNPNVRVLAFEPNPWCYERLAKHITLNGFQKQVQCHRQALGAREGGAQFVYAPGARGAPWGRVVGGVSASRPASAEVQMVRLDDILSREAARVSVMKIDVEGAELQVLQGAENVIDQARPIVVFEISLSFLIQQEGVYSMLMQFFATRGYRGYVNHFGKLQEYHEPLERVFNLWMFPGSAPSSLVGS